MGFWPFQPSRERVRAGALLERVEAASRQPALFAPGAIPDTLEGRIEAVTLHAVLALARLQREPRAQARAQIFTDSLFRAFDSGLREAGVGDLTVPKRMRKLASDFYGRSEAYRAALEAGDQAALAAALERNVGVSAEAAGRLAAHMLTVTAAQAQSPVEALEAPGAWPAFSP